MERLVAERETRILLPREHKAYFLDYRTLDLHHFYVHGLLLISYL